MTDEASNKFEDETPASPQDGNDEPKEIPMIEQAEDCLAQSLLVFLYADLRLLSATGRIRTNFENFVIASDEFAKLSASHLTGGAEDLEKFCSTCTNEGISPAQIMASLLVETRKEMQVRNKGNEEEAETSMFSTILDPSGRREVEEGMHGLFRANYEMIGRDLKADIPAFKARDFPDFERKVDRRFTYIPDMTERMKQVTSKEHVMDQANYAVDRMRTLVNRNSHDELEQIPEGEQAASKVATVSASAEEEGPSSGRQQEISSVSAKKTTFTRRHSSKKTSVGGRGLPQSTIEDVGDAFFSSFPLSGIPEEDEQGETVNSTTVIPEDTLLNMMEDALESREYGKLDFMASYFKDKSVSQLVVLSQARIVWINDWYPLKDCTYAISVDPGKKEVLVAFRGAITRADWKHAKDFKLKHVPNPVKDDFEGKSDTIDLHQGFHRYLFRKRKDNSTTKYDEITNVLHHFGSQMGNYKVVVTGHSLGGALTILFSLWASADQRFTKNGPIKMYTFGNPFVAGKSFVHTFRHQEQMGKLQLARFYNERDGVVFMPISWVGEYQHVGLSIKMPFRRPFYWKCFQKEHKVYYAKETTFWGYYRRGLKSNYFFNMPKPWRIRKAHSLAELQKRLIRVRKKVQQHDEQNNTNYLNQTLQEMYEHYVLDGSHS